MLFLLILLLNGRLILIVHPLYIPSWLTRNCPRRPQKKGQNKHCVCVCVCVCVCTAADAQGEGGNDQPDAPLLPGRRRKPGFYVITYNIYTHTCVCVCACVCACVCVCLCVCVCVCVCV